MKNVTMKSSSVVENYNSELDKIRRNEGKVETDFSNHKNYGYGGWANLFVMNN